MKRKQDVGRFDIQVNDVSIVKGEQTVGDAKKDLKLLRPSERWVGRVHAFVQRTRRHKFLH